jgi:hypothetical protein
MRRKEEIMRKRSVSFVLIAALAVGCATHRPPAPVDGRAAATDDEVGSIVANFWYAPGRAFVCAGSGIMAGTILTFTWGQSYEEASQIMHGGCSEPWIVRPSDIRQAVQ